MQDVAGRLRTAAAVVLPRLPVVVAYLFGSAARGTMRPGSDVDVALVLDQVPEDDRLDVLLRVHEALWTASGVADLDVVVLDGAPLPLRGRVVAERVVLYSRDEPARVELESRVSREFHDFQVGARRLDADLLARHASGAR